MATARRSGWWPIPVAILAGVSAVVLRAGLGLHADHGRKELVFAGGSLAPWAGALIFGVAVLGAAFVVSWAAELLQFDVSPNVAVAAVALLAVLPEYSVDMYLAWTAATIPENAPLALANMTGANRLLIGLGWPAVLLVTALVRKDREIRLEESRWGEVFFLAVATVYSFVIPLKGSLTLLDTAVYLLLFGLYVRYLARQEVVEPQVGGVVEVLAGWQPRRRRLATVLMFAWAGVVLAAAAEPFAEGLKLAGEAAGVSPFLMIQWVAPLASESPEFLVALIFAWRGFATAGLGTLVSSKVNQWTLLVGMVPLAYAGGLLAAGRGLGAIPLDGRQFGELVLTAAQSLLAVMIVLDRRFERHEALLLAVLFLGQFATGAWIEHALPVADQAWWFGWEKAIFSLLYVLLALGWLWRHRVDLGAMGRHVWNEERRPRRRPGS